MREIKLTQGYVALVDDSDYEWLNQHKWYANKNYNTFYALRSVTVENKKTKVLMHRQILGLTSSEIICDHVDLNGLNNQRSNLREATIRQNNCNRSSHKGSTSKYLGVSRVKDYWVAQIKKNYVIVRIGRFRTQEDAANAYNEKALEYHGEFANINKLI